jgi:hypothetical protein
MFKRIVYVMTARKTGRVMQKRFSQLSAGSEEEDDAWKQPSQRLLNSRVETSPE